MHLVDQSGNYLGVLVMPVDGSKPLNSASNCASKRDRLAAHLAHESSEAMVINAAGVSRVF